MTEYTGGLISIGICAVVLLGLSIFDWWIKDLKRKENDKTKTKIDD